MRSRTLSLMVTVSTGEVGRQLLELGEDGLLIGSQEQALKRVAQNPQQFGIPKSGSLGSPKLVVHCDAGSLVSRAHAWVGMDAGGKAVLVDLGSRNGVFLEASDRRVKERTPIRIGRQCTVRLCARGVVTLAIQSADHAMRTIPNRGPMTSPRSSEVATLQLTDDFLRIGRAPDNAVVLHHPQVSRYHCQIRRTDGVAIIEDLDSTNGTFVNGAPIKTAQLHGGDLVCVGVHLFWFERPGDSKHVDKQVQLRLEAQSLGKEVKGRGILQDVSFVVLPAEFVGLIGPSGCGKTTLMNIIAGYDRHASGSVLFNLLDLYRNYGALRGNIGYVPQDDIIHPALTVRESLYYTAKLRLPEDMGDDEINSRVERILDDLGLQDCKDVRIGDPLRKGISGGQRKRVNLAQELITEPTCLFLDEPTSGLDGAREMEVMELLKQVAESGKSVILTTHNVRPHNFEILSNVLLLHRGRVVFYGPAADVFDYFGFGREMPEDVFLRLEGKYCPACGKHYLGSHSTRETCDGARAGQACGAKLTLTPEYWEARFKQSRYHATYVRGRTGDYLSSSGDRIQSPVKRRPGLRQWWTLVRRYWRTKTSDTIGTAVLMLQAPVVGLLFGWSFHGKKSSEMGELLFMMAIAAIWFGATNSCREIASEWTIYRRERMVNLKIPSYVLSKMTVLAPFIFLQCLTLALIAKAMVPAVPCTILSVSGITFVGAMSACAMGLFLSSLLSSTEAAMGLVPIALIPQVLFAGVIIPWKDWQIRPLTALMASRWTLDALADASKAGYSRSISMASQVMDSTRISMFVRRELPSLGVFQDVTILALLGLAFTFLTFLSLKTKDIV